MTPERASLSGDVCCTHGPELSLSFCTVGSVEHNIQGPYAWVGLDHRQDGGGLAGACIRLHPVCNKSSMGVVEIKCMHVVRK